jgi:serine/threonine protein kinase
VRPHDPYIGRDIAGQFRIVERVGAGGMGSVYKAEQPDMNRFVAIKILHPKYVSRPDLVARFRREARAMSHLTHPNTARVFLYGQLEDNACYIVMEHLSGMNLAQHVKAHGPFETARAINIMIQVCGALEEAHRAGIVHRDLKPENIFLCTQGGIQDFPKVLDFGLAKVSEREMRPGSLILTQEGMVFGTPEFMSPEQAQGKTLDARSDIYSLACILYEMLTGKLPFEAKQAMDYITHHIQSPPLHLRDRMPAREFPAGLDEVLQRCLAKRPDDRPATAGDFALLLKEVMQGKVMTGALRALPVDAARQAAAEMVRQGQMRGPQQAAPAAGGQRGPQGGPQGHHDARAPSRPADGDEPMQLPVSRAPYVVLGIAALLAVAGGIALVAALLMK